MATKTTTSAVEAARVAVEQERAKLARWEAEQATAEAELASMQDRAGEEVLDDPSAAERLPMVLAGLRARIEIAGKAITAQRPRVKAAEAAYLHAEADVLERAATTARKALERHQARTDELLKLLAEHEGPFVPERVLLEREHVAGRPFERPLDRSEALVDELAAAERPVQILRALADAEPMPENVRPEEYPSCVWGPEALVPAPAYVAVRDQRDRERAALEEAVPQLEAKVEQLAQELAEAENAPAAARLAPGDRDSVQSRRQRLDHARNQLDEKRAQLRRLTAV